MQNYLKLLRFLKAHKKVFVLAVFFMLIGSVFEGLQLPLLIPFVDILFTGKEVVAPPSAPQFVHSMAAWLNQIEPEQMRQYFWLPILLIFVLKNLVSYLYGFLMNDISQRVMRDIRDKIFEKLQRLSLEYYSRRRTGELISRITHDVNLIENAVSYGVTDLFRQTVMIAVCLTVVVVLNPKAALMMFFFVPFIAIPLSRIGRRLKKISKNQQEKMADINTILLETISGIRIVKAFGTENFEIKRFRKRNWEYYKLQMKSIKRILLISPITEIVGVCMGILMIYWFTGQILNNEMSFGVFVGFFGSIFQMISPIKKLGNVNAITQRALAANERIHEVLEAIETVQDKPGVPELPIIKDKISIEKVDFYYDSKDDMVLKDISVDINVGELVAIVGPTGVGKSTLISLIPRFYDPRAGAIKFDGVDVRDVQASSVRRQIGMVTQETFLFNDTVRNNIAYGSPDATLEQIEEAARKAYAHQFVSEMPEKYDTVIGDRGFRLSGGERQRIAIARAILKNPPILILDEATSQLDSESEKYVQQALDELMKGRTVIAIAHRLSTIKKASKIVVLQGGRVAGFAPHGELLETCELYSRLYQTQFQT